MGGEDIAGVLKFYYHSPRSELPIPDFAGDRNDKGSKKTEPHFLPDNMVAENFLKTCYPRNIKAVIDMDLPYLFWVTRKQEENSKIKNSQVVIGYLEVASHEMREDTVSGTELTGKQHHTIYGKGHLYAFDNAIETREIFGKVLTRVDFTHRFHVSHAQAERMLDHFSELDDIVHQCADEIARLDVKGYTCFPEICPVKQGCALYHNL